MSTVEEKTPKGYTLKIYLNKDTYLVFDPKGKSIFSDPAGLKVMHQIKKIAFLGPLFSVRNRTRPDYSLYKVSKNKIVLPYFLSGDKDRRYLLLDTDEIIDLAPVRLYFISNIKELILQLDAGLKPDAIVVDLSITENDIIIIRNRYADANIIITERSSTAGITKYHNAGTKDDNKNYKRASDDEVNLNMMSDNPIFLARIHLRDMNISKVRQLLLDFDLSTIDADYIVVFIDSVIKNLANDAKSMREKDLLEHLSNDFKFYINIVNTEDYNVKELIDKISDEKSITAYQTYLAKVKSITEDQDIQLKLVDYENWLFEKKESL